MRDPAWLEDGLAYIWQPYAQAKLAPLPLPVKRTEGCHIILEDGTTLIDAISSWWCTPHGHNHPHLIAAAKAQLDVMPNVMFAGLAHEPAYRLARRLCAIAPRATQDAPLTRVFFSDSGSTAVEVALKIALQYWHNQGITQKYRFACLTHAYHGDTFGAMGVSDPARGMHSAYRPTLTEAIALDMPHNASELDMFEQELIRHKDHLAALFVEPLVQGAGGLRFHDASMLCAVRRLCQTHDVLFVADEIMTGFGRTSTMFACEQAEITPDILCVGKGLTGGVMTLAATLATERIYDAFYSDELHHALMHGPTFMGNPLACAIANASLDLYENEPRLSQVAAIETQLLEALEPLHMLDIVTDIRVRGAIGVVALDTARFDPFAIRPEFIKRGCWLRPFRDIIYVMPPFTISREQLDMVTQAISEIVHQLAQA